LFIIYFHDLLGEVLKKVLSQRYIDYTITVHVILLENLINVSFDGVIVAVCWSTIWQFI